MRTELPQFLRDELSSPPKATCGVHRWMFRIARHLHAHMPVGEIINLLESRIANCGRRVPRREIVDAVKNSIGCAWNPSTSGRVESSRWPSVNRERRDAVVQGGDGLADLWEMSPLRIEDNESTEIFIDYLFPGNPLLCCGARQDRFATLSRAEWRGKLRQLQFIVPAPMTARVGLTQGGKESAHALSNTGPRRFLVVEFDSGTADEHAAILLHLGARGPLAMVVHSGGKSLHGWFCCVGQPDEQLGRFMEYAVSLGADRATWTRSQFVRMPDGIRDSGMRQAVFFFDPKVIQ